MIANDNAIKPFKGRTIDESQPVLLYRNIKRKGKIYSIKQKNVVVAHTTAICLKDVTFVINKGAKAEAIRSKIRNVHAFIKGYITPNGMGTTAKNNDLPVPVKYNPFSDLGFYHEITINKKEMNGARFIIANHEGVKAAYTY